MKIDLPDDVRTVKNSSFVAHLIPSDGFEKLIGYKTEKGSWVHKEYKPKKTEEKTKKNRKKT